MKYYAKVWGSLFKSILCVYGIVILIPIFWADVEIKQTEHLQFGTRMDAVRSHNCNQIDYLLPNGPKIICIHFIVLLVEYEANGFISQED